MSKAGVYIVEDSPLVRERLTSLLSDIPDVDKASCVPGPTLLLLDIRLTGGTGMRVIQALRTGAHATSIVVLDHLCDPGYRKRYLDAGARYFYFLG
jgi:DNA-binding NarL/FixJ family response regulator